MRAIAVIFRLRLDLNTPMTDRNADMRHILSQIELVTGGTVTEAAEEIVSQTGKKVIVLRNPSRAEAMKAIGRYGRKTARCLLEVTTGTLFMCDKWDMYHYQMLKQLGLNEDDCVGFAGFADGIGLYFPRDDHPIANKIHNENVVTLKASKALKRVWGPDFAIKETEPD